MGSRSRNSRPRRRQKRRILVVTEGTRTEPLYLDGLSSYLRSKGATTVVTTVRVGKDPLKVVHKCVEKRDAVRSDADSAYDECVCLVDVDQHQTLQEAIRVAKRESIALLISNVKFEVWLRWHKEDKRSALTSAQLDELTERLGLVIDKKLSRRFPYSNVYDACEIARSVDPDLAAGRVGPDPSSAMPLLVDLMLGT